MVVVCAVPEDPSRRWALWGARYDGTGAFFTARLRHFTVLLRVSYIYIFFFSVSVSVSVPVFVLVAMCSVFRLVVVFYTVLADPNPT